jgi:hypothetical protein
MAARQKFDSTSLEQRGRESLQIQAQFSSIIVVHGSMPDAEIVGR